MASPKIGVPTLVEGGPGNYQLVNQGFGQVESGFSSLINKQTAPPGGPSNGDAYLVDGTGTGDWAGQDNNIAVYLNGWKFYAPFKGMRVLIEDEDLVLLYDGTNWMAIGGHQTLTDAATIAWDGELGQSAQVTLTANRTLGAPTNFIKGMFYSLRVIQDGTGSRTLTYNGVFRFPGGTAPTLTTAAGSVDLLTFVYDGSNFDLVSSQLNLS